MALEVALGAQAQKGASMEDQLNIALAVYKDGVLVDPSDYGVGTSDGSVVIKLLNQTLELVEITDADLVQNGSTDHCWATKTMTNFSAGEMVSLQYVVVVDDGTTETARGTIQLNTGPSA